MSSPDTGYAQRLGRQARQEDGYLCETLPNGSLLACVADGMGGVPGGDQASQVVTRSITAAFAVESSPDSAFRLALEDARSQLTGLEEADPALKGLGSTLTCILLEPGPPPALRWLNVGDSHLYLLRGRRLRHLSQNHNLGAVLEAQGGETQPGDHALEPAMYSHILLSAVTSSEPEMVDLPTDPFHLQAGDRLLLATDGLDVLAPDQIKSLLSGSATAQELADTLVGAAEDTNRIQQDNVTVVVILL